MPALCYVTDGPDRALVRRHGEQVIRCEECGRVYAEAEHEWLVSDEVRTAKR